MFKRRVPFIPQVEAVECGAASLAMILAYHGRYEALSLIRRACGVSRDGTTAKHIVAAARTYGLTAKGKRMELDGLPTVATPAILHWRMEHFVVLEGMEPDGRARIVDPALGPRRVPVDELDKSFTGICLEFSPNDQFKKQKKESSTARRVLGLLGGFGAPVALLAWTALIIDLLSVATPITAQILIDQVVGAGHHSWLVPAGAILLGLVVVSIVCAVLRDVFTLRIRRYLDERLTIDFVTHLFDLPLGFFSQRQTGELVGRVRSLQSIRDLLGAQTSAMLVDGAMLIGYLIVMIVFDAELAMLVLVMAALYLIAFLVSRPILADIAQERELRASASMSSLIGMLRGIATIKAVGGERRARTQWLNTFISALNTTSKFALQLQSTTVILGLLRLGAVVLVLLVGGRRALLGEISIGTLVGFQLMQAGFLGPLQKIMEAILGLQSLPTVLARMDDVNACESEPTGDKEAPPLTGKLEVKNVTFRYAEQSAAVLEDISFTIESQSKVAFVGGSGSGKSTLAKLLLGLYRPTSGQILYDGQDLATLDLASMRRQFGVVLQDTALFAGTIGDNLRLSHPNAPMEHVVAAARVAQIHDDIEALPLGYDSLISDGGAPFSGGQRQRLALARAILHRPPILILDEATSALDTLTEAAIERYLTTRRCTRVVIAHRLSTVRDADTIFVFEEGKIAESGRHEDLCAAGGPYARLVEAEAQVASKATEPEAEAREQPLSADDLAPFSIFAALGEVDRHAIAELLERRTYRDGDVILQQEEKPSGLHLLVSGEVAIELAEPGLETWTVAELASGEIFGELSLLDGSPNSASARAKGAVRTLHLPIQRFQDLAKLADTRTTKIVLALGGLVVGRTRAVVERELGALQESRRSPVVAPEEKPVPRARTQALPLRESLLCATMSDADVGVLQRRGTEKRLRAGETLFDSRAAPTAVYVVLSGRVSYRMEGGAPWADHLDPGEIAGETSPFDLEPAPLEAIAVTDAVLFSIDRASFLDLVLSGAPAGQKAFAYVARAVVMQLRLANFRLRETVARNRGELAQALRAREEALEAAATGRAGVSDDDEHHLVRADRSEDSCAASLATLLRQLRRPASLGRVQESLEQIPGEMSKRLGIVARTFGLFARRLDLLKGELLRIEQPLIAQFDGDEWRVLLPGSRGRALVLDPMRGAKQVSIETLESEFTGVAFEILEEDIDRRSLTERVRAFFAHRWKDVLGLGILAVAVDGVTLFFSMATAAVVTYVVPLRDSALLQTLVVGSVAALAAYALFSRFQARIVEYVRAHFDRDLVDQMARHLLGLPISFFDKHPPGDVLQRFMAFETVRNLISSQGLPAFFSLVSLSVSALLLAILSPRLALFAGSAVIFYAIGARILLPRLRAQAGRSQRARIVEFGRLIESIANITTFRLCGDRRTTFRRYLEAFSEALDAMVSEETWRTIGLTVLDGVRNVILALSVLFGASSVVDGQLGLGGYAAAIGVMATFLLTLHGVMMLLLGSSAAAVEYELVRSTFEEEPEQKGGPGVIPGRLRGAVSLENVSFRYDKDSPVILKNVSLEVPAGAKVAIVGGSGSGKSTLGKLLLGLYLPTQGRVLFDGKDISSLDLQSLRGQIGVVLQEPYLLQGTIRDNLILGAEQATPEQIEEAARRAAIHDMIAALPMGYATLVSEGGGAFSGGQRQRCVLARALITRPAILLLDEATSALDNISQNTIEAHLADMRSTRVVIAHRLSTVRNADVIIVLDKGRIVETGNHDELVSRGGSYAKLVEAQL